MTINISDLTGDCNNEKAIIQIGFPIGKHLDDLEIMRTIKPPEIKLVAVEERTFGNEDLSFQFDYQEMFKNMREILLQQMEQCHEDVLKQVLSALLKREPTIEDAKKVTMASHNDYPGQWLMAYEDKQLGMVYETEDGVEFIGGVLSFSNDDPRAFNMRMKKMFPDKKL